MSVSVNSTSKQLFYQSGHWPLKLPVEMQPNSSKINMNSWPRGWQVSHLFSGNRDTIIHCQVPRDLGSYSGFAQAGPWGLLSQKSQEHCYWLLTGCEPGGVLQHSGVYPCSGGWVSHFTEGKEREINREDGEKLNSDCAGHQDDSTSTCCTPDTCDVNRDSSDFVKRISNLANYLEHVPLLSADF